MTPEQQVIVNLQKLLHQVRFSDWINNDIFTFGWWVLLLSLIIPWFIWYRLVDKGRLKEMLLYLAMTSSIAILLDEIGSTLTMWVYPVKVIPILPRLIPANYSMVPIIFVLIYQYFPKWKSFIIANIILTFVFSFILEPILVWMNLYDLITWKYIYSIPTYLFTAILLKWFIEKIKLIQENAKGFKSDREV
ncbi:MAG TPA: CBO0543 family protein [Clostridia bacterium]|nr:CBO0543 family protein [Clostridia bacterium]